MAAGETTATQQASQDGHDAKQKDESQQSIFDLGDSKKKESETTAMLKAAFKDVKNIKDVNQAKSLPENDKSKSILEQIALEESKKSIVDIYDEVFLDEVNAELI